MPPATSAGTPNVFEAFVAVLRESPEEEEKKRAEFYALLARQAPSGKVRWKRVYEVFAMVYYDYDPMKLSKLKEILGAIGARIDGTPVTSIARWSQFDRSSLTFDVGRARALGAAAEVLRDPRFREWLPDALERFVDLRTKLTGIASRPSDDKIDLKSDREELLELHRELIEISREIGLAAFVRFAHDVGFRLRNPLDMYTIQRYR